MGFISLDSRSAENFDPEIAEALGGFASQAGIAIRNARLFAEVEYYSSVLEEAIDIATAELRGMVDRIEVILNNSPDPTLLLTAEGRIDLVNPAFERSIGPSGDYIAQPVASVFGSQWAEPVKQAVAGLKHTPETRRLEATAISRDSTPLEVDVALAPIRDDDELVGIVCTLHDISEMKEVERLKDSFLSTAAHELRTPLTSIRGFSEILLSRELKPERQHTYLTFINQQAVQLGNIIDDLLDVSRLQAGRALSMNLEATAVGPIVEGVLMPYAETSAKHSFVTSGLAAAPAVRADPFRLEQVFRNLVSNAVKYSPNGGEIRISAAPQDAMLEVRITDSGIGLTHEQQKHLFEPFYRAANAQQHAMGTGLGLSISRAIVELHGGTIDVTSVPDVGSTFSFTVPLAEKT
jgi:PAS domain S-box-containing protein